MLISPLAVALHVQSWEPAEREGAHAVGEKGCSRSGCGGQRRLPQDCGHGSGDVRLSGHHNFMNHVSVADTKCCPSRQAAAGEA